MVRLIVLLCIAVAILTGCSSGGDDGPDPATVVQAQPGTIVVNGDDVGLPGCLWRIRAPVGFEPGSAALLVQRRVAKPGGKIIVAVLNDSDDPITYGQAAFFRDLRSGRPILESDRRAVFAVGYLAEPGRVGNCVTIPVPKRIAPGRYEVVLDQVPRVEGKELTAPVRIR